MSDNSPAATLLRSKSAPAKIHSSQSDSDDENLQVKQKKDGFLSRTILAPILFLSFIFSLAIVDRKRRLEDERMRGELTKRRRLLYLSLFWTLPRTSIKNPKSRTSSPCHSNSSSRRGSGSSEPGGETTAHDSTSKAPEIRTLAERKQEARTLTDEAFQIQNRVIFGMSVFSVVSGLLLWVTYLKVKELLGFDG